jgi:hypothetical protein
MNASEEKQVRQPNKKKSNSRPNIDRLSVSVPKGMGTVIKLLAKEADLDQSKMLRKGFDAYMKANGDSHLKSTRDEYWKLRSRWRDE